MLAWVAYPESVPSEGDVVSLPGDISKKFEGVRVFGVRKGSHAIKSIGDVYRRCLVCELTILVRFYGQFESASTKGSWVMLSLIPRSPTFALKSIRYRYDVSA